MMLQAEQDRSTTIEAAAASDRARIEEAIDGLGQAKARADKDMRFASALRKDLTAVDARLFEVSNQLDANSSQSSLMFARIDLIEENFSSSGRKVDQLQAWVEDVNSALNTTNGDIGDHVTKLSSCQNSLDDFRKSHHEMHGDFQGLRVAHEEVAGSLMTAQVKLQTALDRADAIQRHVDATCNRVHILEESFSKDLEHREQLQGASEVANRALVELRTDLDDARSSVSRLDDKFIHENVAAQEHRVKLDDASSRLVSMQNEGRQTYDSLLRLHADVAEGRESSQRQAAHVANVVERLTIVQSELKRTMLEVQDVRAYISAM